MSTMQTGKRRIDTYGVWGEALDKKEITKQVEKYIKRNIEYSQDKILGFPGTRADSFACDIYSMAIDAHPNNIGMHCNSEGDCEIGFAGSQEAEREVIKMLASIMGGDPSKIEGYISPGGTEANIMGCWMGRDAKSKKKDKKTAIICSALTHYSVVKAAQVLNIGTKIRNGAGMRVVGCDNNGHILLDKFKSRLNAVVKAGVTNVIVIGNAGTTMLGSVDNMPEMAEIIAKFRKHYPEISFHFHVDAAFGGLIIPFLPNLPKIGFYNSEVDSVAIDLHKMGPSPYGAGVFLARKGMFEITKSKAPYVPGDDCTLCGSRSGAMAISVWAMLKHKGIVGYQETSKRLMELTAYTRDRFRSFGIDIFEPDINIIAVKKDFPGFLNNNGGYITHIHDKFPIDLANPRKKGKTKIWNVVIMEHTTEKLIDNFFNEVVLAN
jgi:tyrosine decarboxylase/aspartate 1-decarboxylase